MTTCCASAEQSPGENKLRSPFPDAPAREVKVSTRSACKVREGSSFELTRDLTRRLGRRIRRYNSTWICTKQHLLYDSADCMLDAQERLLYVLRVATGNRDCVIDKAR